MSIWIQANAKRVIQQINVVFAYSILIHLFTIHFTIIISMTMIPPLMVQFASLVFLQLMLRIFILVSVRHVDHYVLQVTILMLLVEVATPNQLPHIVEFALIHHIDHHHPMELIA